jgi:hypothetical protein
VPEHQPRDPRVGGNLQVQADIAPIAGLADLVQTQNETVGFHDAAAPEVGGYMAAIDSGSASDQTENMDLVKFLSRPVRIATFTWNESDAVATSHTYNPWNLFFTDTRVQYKLNNFSFIQCKLKIKILINASPFYYGSMYCGYQPLPALTPSSIVSSTGTQQLIPYSQRPCVWLSPQHNQGAEMELPFFYYKNWLNAQSASDMTNMGQLTFLNYTALQSANGVTGDGVSIAVYAWAEDVKLSGPSVGLATQSLEVQGDEYGKGPVSSVASAIASAAGYFKNIPVIGKFATATQMGASAVSSIAKLFGFTNVPVIADTQPFRPEPFPKMASTDIGFPIEKLTLDAKNELTIDPTAIGLKAEDEMAISSLVQRDSYLCTATWASSSAVDTILFASAVCPMLQDQTAQATTLTFYQTPMAWLSSMFLHWRGDIIFKFKVIASVYHKGRLRISFDPAGSNTENIYTDANSANVVFTEIVDLGDTNEVEMRIPFQQAYPFLLTQNYLTAPQWWSTSSSPSFSGSPTLNNGVITVRVQTILTSPTASSSVSILVHVRAADNFELANPRDLQNSASMFQVQSAESPSVSTVVGTGLPNVNEQRNLVHFGERVLSLRQLLRRYTMVNLDHVGTSSNSNNLCIWQKIFTKLPPMYGFDPYGQNSAKGLVVTASNFAFNFTQPHPLNWVAPAFVAYRGSTNWTFNLDFGAPISHVRVVRTPDSIHVLPNKLNQLAATTSSSDSVIAQTALNCLPGSSGSALVSQQTNAGLNVQLPMYTFTRFQSTAPSYTMHPSTVDGAQTDTYILEVACDPASKNLNGGVLWTYCAAGTDFGLHFFLNVPSWILYNPITPN